MECKLKNLTMYYEEYGEGTPILMLHGYYPDHRLMTGCMEPVFKKHPGYRRIYVDLPGMGRTEASKSVYNSDSMLDTVLEFIEHAIPEGNFLLAGESYGGYLVRGIVARLKARVDGALFLCPMIIADHEKRELPAHVVLSRDEAFLASVKDENDEGFFEMAVVQDESTWSRYRAEILPGIRLVNAEYLERIRRTGYGFSFNLDAEEAVLCKPTLFLTARQDASTGYRDAYKILEHYPRATFAALDRAGHNLQIEQPALFEALTEEWLRRVEEAKRARM